MFGPRVPYLLSWLDVSNTSCHLIFEVSAVWAFCSAVRYNAFGNVSGADVAAVVSVAAEPLLLFMRHFAVPIESVQLLQLLNGPILSLTNFVDDVLRK